MKTYTLRPYDPAYDKDGEFLAVWRSHPDLGDDRIGKYPKPTGTVKFFDPIDVAELSRVQQDIEAVVGKE